ncbi:hypothetical protein BC936DRAFT_144376 [Jimgerdemannia flammicorona]|uniref:Uncharacterized protein n=2 Tax=Jimgerdemannia flammicorona TaxID=994334 RepID=A0A433QPB2_9FUNG|nr:hypothetical protein BC936DRAFT_144376 [Jimgerdemannia flammicorona]RUS31597.1 hypothetical protein BC938DRAFT_477477 [Jimgerdemannia flammicorona]
MTKFVTKVVVVGAGLSGLQAARLLHKQGIDVHVVEASERIGGRTKGHTFGEDGKVDLGGAFMLVFTEHFDQGFRTLHTEKGTTLNLTLQGQWVGRSQKHIIKLLEELDISLYDQYVKGNKLQVHPKYGNKTYTGTIPPLSATGLADLQLNGINRIERLMQGINMDDPSLSDNAIEFDNMTLESFANVHCKTEDAKQTIALATRTLFGAEPGEISFLFFLYYMKAGGGLTTLISSKDGAQEFKISSTASSIAFRLADDLPSDQIHLKAPASRLVQTDTGVTVYTGYPGAEGPTIEADYAILAIPPSQAGHIKYEPDMPFERVKLCEKAFMGAIVKIFVRYVTAFWRDDGYAGETIFYDSDNELSPISMQDPMKVKARILTKLVECFGEKANNPIDWVAQEWNTVTNMYGAYSNNLPPGCLSLFGDALRTPVGRVHFAGTEAATEDAGYLSGALQSAERAANEVSECIRENTPWLLIGAHQNILEEKRARKPAMHTPVKKSGCAIL